jgi:hypothetical protein
MESTVAFSAADLAYIEANFMQLQSGPASGPQASYVLPDGRQFYPLNYIELQTNEAEFKSRLARACASEGIARIDADETWQAYMTGIYGVCLHAATPENIARKNALLQRIEDLAAAPDEQNHAWVRSLKEAVDALDRLERPFSPHYDRVRFGRPPTRDSHIAQVRERFPQIDR